jgi:hypothetical protein
MEDFATALPPARAFAFGALVLAAALALGCGGNTTADALV